MEFVYHIIQLKMIMRKLNSSQTAIRSTRPSNYRIVIARRIRVRVVEFIIGLGWS